MKEEKKEKKEFVAVQVPIQHQEAIQTPEGEIIGIHEAVARIANDVEEIKKGLVG